MSWSLILKFIHITSAALMIGGSTANGIMELNLKVKTKFKKSTEIKVIMNQVKLINVKIVFPSLLVLFLSGLALLYSAQMLLYSIWILYSIILFVFIFAIYFVGKNSEDNLEKAATTENAAEMEKYHKKILVFGPLASILILAILYLMISKPY